MRDLKSIAGEPSLDIDREAGFTLALFLLFVVIPIIEIALFIEVGGRIGLWTTLAIILATAAIGSFAIRSQGRSMMRALAGAGPTGAADLLSQGLLLFVAGMFLITPGFLTDALGLSLLIPPVRRRVRDYLARRMSVVATGGFAAANPHAATADPSASADRRPSPGAGSAESRTTRAAASERAPRNEKSPWRDDQPSNDVEDAQILDEKRPER